MSRKLMLPVLLVALTGCTSGTTSVAPTTGTTSSAAAAQSLPAPKNWSERSAVAMYQCMKDKGWQVTLNADFSMTGAVPPEQRATHTQDTQACQKTYEAVHPPAPMTADRAKKLYALELTTVDCLAREGISQPSEPITEQQYVDEYLRQGYPSWTAYRAVPDIGAVEKKCPQPGIVLAQP